MDSLFTTYLQLGFEHISDPKAYDHIVFLVALCAIYRPQEWKRVLLLVTAFTIGHSLTLLLAVLDIIRFPGSVIELLIPITILATAFYNVSQPAERGPQAMRWNYAFALFFGFIHGMGFSNYLRALLMPGEEGQLWLQLLAFNLGIELGQIMIVACILLLAGLAFGLLRVKAAAWNQFVSGAAAGIALTLLLQQWT
ncbi:MAG: HupE/UreJ family protein [Bacteroidota bacterium]